MFATVNVWPLLVLSAVVTLSSEMGLLDRLETSAAGAGAVPQGRIGELDQDLTLELLGCLRRRSGRPGDVELLTVERGRSPVLGPRGTVYAELVGLVVIQLRSASARSRTASPRPDTAARPRA